MAARRLSASSIDSHNYDVSPRLHPNPNVFDDEYAASFAPSSRSHSPGPDIARLPSPAVPEQISPPLDPVSSPIPSSSRLSEDVLPPPRHSVTKSRSFGAGESSSDSDVTLTGEQPTTPHNVTVPATAAGMAHRTLSSASSFSFARSPSPNQGEEPSHPYGMYPQGLGVSRSASVATASTAAGPGRATSHRAPAHPYALYPQGVGIEDTSGNQTNSIPVGFPGLGTHFHRRLGPEGEEQDIVGVDGHTEQLPPYTRYPEEYSPKFGGVGALPAIGEAVADRPAARESPVDADEVSDEGQHRPRSQDNVLSSGGSNESSSTPTSQTEKSWNEKTWREKRKTKVFGMPVWVLICLFVLIIIIACVTGAVVGAFVGRNVDQAPPPPPKPDFASSALPTTTLVTYYDATPAPTPTAYPELESGTYEVVLGLNPVKGYNNCVTTPWQSSAWNCTLTQPSIDFVIGKTPTNWTLGIPFPSDAQLRYGPQIPNIPPQNLSVVLDLGDLALHQAYHFQTTYDKLVIIPEHWLHPSNPNVPQGSISNRERNIGDLVDTVYDYPWYCYWDDTFLEAFVFMSQNVAVNTDSPVVNDPSFSSLMPTSTSISPNPGSPMIGSPTTPPSADSTATYPQQTTADTDSNGYGASTTPNSGPNYRRRAGSTPNRRDAENYGYQKTPDFTKLVKVEERRIPPVAPTPYVGPTCTKMHFGRGSTKPTPYPVPSTNGELYIVNVDEQSPPPLPWVQPQQGSSLSRWFHAYRALGWGGNTAPLEERQVEYNGGGDPYGKYVRGMWEDGCYCRWENERRPAP